MGVHSWDKADINCLIMTRGGWPETEDTELTLYEEHRLLLCQ